MTENEAIEILKKPCLCDYDLSYTIESCDISSCDRRKATITAIKALEKQNAKKPVKRSYIIPYECEEIYVCPGCKKLINHGEHHCKCGQKIDWSEVK